ncbi:phosphate starvation-inducible PhoH-like protein [Saccharothrix tamanrassetensis]|uniref:PhoH-like protein n=1 Tax=Saccharothrix tamanrassetensis TaxID=1051531 RepID=A0A841CNT6_9PSEU|nr:phosphate starvation-inducible PhoH-like protein [Saccharothrix tamanrassetensis]
MADTADNTPQAGHAAADAQSKFAVPDGAVLALLGSRDENLRLAEELLDADVHVRGNEITLSGQPADVAFAERVFSELITLAGRGQQVGPDTVRRTVAMLSAGTSESPAEVLSLDIISRRGRTIRPKTLNQKHYVDAIDQNTVVFGIGPAGTGKTYLAMAKAVQALQAKQVNRIILTRPAVEAGERLGYLPGTLYEKIDPYLRPLYDALHDMVDPESIPRLTQAGTIEVAPLAYMRGRAQPVSTDVLTPDGFRPIGELEVGDLVIGSNGEPTPVLGVYPQGEKDVYRVTAQDGASTLCCGDHLWTVRTASDHRRDEPWRVLETKELIGDLGAAPARRYELPLLSAPACQPERPFPLDPYALGLLLGDGRPTGSHSPATEDGEAVPTSDAALTGAEVRREVHADRTPDRVRTAGAVATLEDPVTEALGSLSPLGTHPHTRFVPDVYLDNTAHVRLAVLQGLLDAAGEPVTGVDRTCGIRYTTTSPALRDGVLRLVRSLGGVAHVHRRPATGRAPECADDRPEPHLRDTHLVDIRLPEGVEPFRLAHKQQEYRAAGGGGRPERFIDRIEPAGRAEAVCIQVAAADSLYVTEDYLLTHNTLNDAFIILDEAQNTTPEQMKMFLTRLGFGSKIVVTGDITQIDLPGGQRSGLKVVKDILDGVDDVHFSILTSSDVVRHRLVADIVDAYEKWQVEQDEHDLGEGRQQHAGPGARSRGHRRGR